MKVSELGEFGLIDLLAKTVSRTKPNRHPRQPELIVGIGDDTAAWKEDSSIRLATVDSLVQDVHFSLETISWSELGWKSLAVNLSDIAAIGGAPGYALVSLSLPGDTQVEDVVAFYEGMNDIAQRFGVCIVGGDTCRAPIVSITITLLGNSRSQNLLRRSGAVPGDMIAVTGYPGSAAAGFEMMTYQLQFNEEATTCLRNAFHRPWPRITEGQRLVEYGAAAAIDISDGLIADLEHICQASHVSARLEVDSLPIHPVVKENFGEKATRLALTGGEDYELLFTADVNIMNKVKREIQCPVTVIGRITDEEPYEVGLFDNSGNPVKIDRSGWDHFKASK